MLQKRWAVYASHARLPMEMENRQTYSGRVASEGKGGEIHYYLHPSRTRASEDGVLLIGDTPWEGKTRLWMSRKGTSESSHGRYLRGEIESLLDKKK